MVNDAGPQSPGRVLIERLPAARLDEARPLLVDLHLAEQAHFDHPQQSRVELDRWLPRTRPTFRGENHLFVGRADGRVVGLCWCVLYDPGTGLEGEVAELYVVPEHRGRGLAGRLVAEATRLFGERGVTFASVWTRPDNPPALSLYARHGFTPSGQVVLTWYPPEAAG